MGQNQSSPSPIPERKTYRPGIGGMRREAPSIDHIKGYGEMAELYPYGLPPPPRSFAFGGLGWGYGIGCSVGPFFGVGVGYGVPGGVLFGAGTGLGRVCGVGFGGGLISGLGTAYVPVGLNFSILYAPKFLRLERAVENWRLQRAEQLRKRKRERTLGTLPEPLRSWGYGILMKIFPQTDQREPGPYIPPIVPPSSVDPSHPLR